MDLTRFKECPALKNSVYIDTQNKVAPCCYYKQKFPIEILNDWGNYQTELNKIDIEQGCKHCINLEEAGSETSHRINFVNRYNTVLAKNELEISICVDNICNLKCTSCSPVNSSLWLTDALKLNLIEEKNKKQFLADLKGSELKLDICKKIIESSEENISVALFGGEPTINPAVISFLDWMVDLPNARLISLTFVTNGTTILPNMETYINTFRFTDVNISLDGIGARNDFLRYGSDWKDLEQNAIRYNQLSIMHKNFECRVHLTLSVLNAYYFHEFCDWVATTISNMELVFTKLVFPEYLSLDILTPQQKQIVLEHNLKQLDNIKGKGSIKLDFIIKHYTESMTTYVTQHNSDDVPMMFDFLDKLDTIRSTDFRNTFPEIINIINNAQDTTKRA